MPFQGIRVLSLESRRSGEMAELIRKQGGDPVVAPSMREIPVAENSELVRFARSLLDGQFDMLVVMTGVGLRQLKRAIAAQFSEDVFVDALRKVAITARGPKPVAALHEMGLTPAVVAPEPNTWRELLAVMDGQTERRIAVQEYGRSNPEFLEALRRRGAEVTPIHVYQYGLPEDCGPLRDAVRRLAAGDIQVALFTSAMQIENLVRLAREAGQEAEAIKGLQNSRIMSIGPTTTEALEEFGLHAEFEPSRPKMGLLVREAAERVSAG